MIEVKKLNYDELLAMDDVAPEGLLQDSDPEKEARYRSLAAFFPNIEKELTRTSITRGVLWGGI